MRRSLILIVIAVLPLRVWASGVMLLQMAAADVAGTAAVHASSHVAFSDAANDGAGSGCSLHADAGPQTGDSSADECKVCDLCAPLIETFSSCLASVVPMQSAALAAPSSATSILPDSAFKPPRLPLLLS